MKEAWDFLVLGGPVMVPIALCSVAALAIFLERMLALQRHRIVPQRFVSLVREHLAAGRIAEAEALCRASETTVAAVLLAGIRQSGAPREVVRESMQDRGRREIATLERFTGVLGAVVTLSPLLGLLGTVTGMIETFQTISASSEAGQISPGALANGIWEALITTAAGLTVAIPAFVLYRVVMARVDSLIGEMEEVSLETAELIVRASERAGGAA